MNKLVLEYKKDETLLRYLELRKLIMSNSKLQEALKDELSVNKAKNSNFEYKGIIDEYIEVQNMVKSDLEMIANIIKNELEIG